MKPRLIFLLAVLSLTMLPAFAESAADLRSRMEQRLPSIDDLKAKGYVGENNRGFLEVRDSGSSTAGGIVSAENRDREAVYALIAQQTGASADSVGQARAKQIASNSRSGVWVQDESGQWKKK